MVRKRGPLDNATPAVAALLLSVVLVYFVNKSRTDALYDQVADLRVQDTSLEGKIVTNRRDADATFKAADGRFSKQQKNVDKLFKGVGKQIDSNQQAMSESIDATNVEVEQVKGVVSGLDSRVSSDIASVRSEVAGVSSDLYNTNSRVSGNSARAEQIYQEVTQVAGGLEQFYNDIKEQTEWTVHGPGGCNDGFNGEAKHPWKLTRSFVHSRQKITLDNCKLLCKSKSPWGCKYISFYGAGTGWCYGFQKCEKHTTGQGWGGYTTYARRELAELGPPQ